MSFWTLLLFSIFMLPLGWIKNTILIFTVVFSTHNFANHSKCNIPFIQKTYGNSTHTVKFPCVFPQSKSKKSNTPVAKDKDHYIQVESDLWSTQVRKNVKMRGRMMHFEPFKQMLTCLTYIPCVGLNGVQQNSEEIRSYPTTISFT